MLAVYPQKQALQGPHLPSLKLEWGCSQGVPNHAVLAPSGPSVAEEGAAWWGRGRSSLGTELPSSIIYSPPGPGPPCGFSCRLQPRLVLVSPNGVFSIPWPAKGQEDLSHVACEGESSLRIDEVGGKQLGSKERGSDPLSHTLSPPCVESFLAN